jgi:hypothetical protein
MANHSAQHFFQPMLCSDLPPEQVDITAPIRGTTLPNYLLLSWNESSFVASWNGELHHLWCARRPPHCLDTKPIACGNISHETNPSNSW